MDPALRAPNLDAALLAQKVAALAATPGVDGEVLRALDAFVRTAPDAALVRINPLQFALERGFAAGSVVDAFLRARKAGLVTMEWQYVCPTCGDIVERLSSLTNASAHVYCAVCVAEREADLSAFVEVTFSVAPEVRRSPYHDPWSLAPDEHFFGYRFTQSGRVDDGTPLRDLLRRDAIAFAYLEPGAAKAFEFEAKPGVVWLTDGPALEVGAERTDERRTFAYTYTGPRSKGFEVPAAAGPVRIEVTNATDRRHAVMIAWFREHYMLAMAPFLSGAQLLSNQTFRDLFGAETITAGEGLAVKRIALLFTDLKGSTALYERIGDIKAFELVRRHFDYLRECIAAHSGALVKTIGDAVMASFVDAGDALRAALAMRATIARYNAQAGGEMLGLKIGLHAGACLAVTLNDRLDYFGQTVNIAARVQGLAGADEIIVTDDVLASPGAAAVLRGLALTAGDVELKGVVGAIRVHRIGGGA